MPGGGARLAGARAKEAARARPSGERWEHLNAEQRRELQAGYLALYAERIERPTAYRSPLGACGLCGVAEVTMLPSQARTQAPWVELDVDPTSLGGNGPEALTVTLCPACDEAVDRAGAVGPSAMQQAVVTHLGAAAYARSVGVIDGLLGWAVAGARPNAEPWQHVNLDAVREYLRDAGALSGRTAIGDYQPLQRVR